MIPNIADIPQNCILQNSKKTRRTQTMSKKYAVILIVILTAALCTAGVLAAVNSTDSKDTPADNTCGKKPGFDENAGEYKAPEQKPNIAVPGWESVTIPANYSGYHYHHTQLKVPNYFRLLILYIVFLHLTSFHLFTLINGSCMPITYNDYPKLCIKWPSNETER